MGRTKEELTISLQRALYKIKALNSELTETKIWGREGWSRADLFETTLKSKQNYYMSSNSKWYREGLNE